jgi:hypothetical protein
MRGTGDRHAARPSQMSRERRRFFDFDIVMVWVTHRFYWFGLTHTLVYAAEISQGWGYAGCPDAPAKGATFKDAAAQIMVS